MSNRFLTGALIALMLFNVVSAAHPQRVSDHGTVIENVTLISPERATPLLHADVLIRGGRIAQQAGTYNTTITFNIKGLPGVVLNVQASAYVTKAAASLSTTSLDFGTVNLGSTSSSQAVTVTNTSTAPLSIAAADNGANSNHLLGSYYQP